MILSKTVSVRPTCQNKEYYAEKGYDVTQKQIDVMICDLKDNAEVLVDFSCDYCGELFQRKWYSYVKSVHEDFDKDACCKCSGRRVAEYKKIKYGTMKPTEISQKIIEEDLFKKKSYQEIKKIIRRLWLCVVVI